MYSITSDIYTTRGWNVFVFQFLFSVLCVCVCARLCVWWFGISYLFYPWNLDSVETKKRKKKKNLYIHTNIALD